MRADSTEASAGTALKVESVCQSWLALLRIARRWSAGTTLPFSSMVVRITRWVPVPCEPTLVISSGPKRRENAIWMSSVTSWPRNTSTECSSSIGPRCGIGGVIGGDVGKRHAAQFRRKARAQRNDVHGEPSAVYGLLGVKSPAKTSGRQGAR